METIENIVYILDSILDTKRKRHIVGGLFLSLSALFGGLSITIYTIKENEK